MKKQPVQNGDAGVQAWLDGVKPEHQGLVKRVDALIREMIPEVRCTIKWRKPSQPLGVPFYGTPGKGWVVAMWSFKDRVGVGFIAGTLLDPEPPVTSMSGPWNRGADYKARRIDIHNENDLDEKQMRRWLKQVKKLPGWSSKSPELAVEE